MSITLFFSYWLLKWRNYPPPYSTCNHEGTYFQCYGRSNKIRNSTLNELNWPYFLISRGFLKFRLSPLEVDWKMIWVVELWVDGCLLCIGFVYGFPLVECSLGQEKMMTCIGKDSCAIAKGWEALRDVPWFSDKLCFKDIHITWQSP